MHTHPTFMNVPMTVGELKRRLRSLPDSTPIYLVTDKSSPDAWDEAHDRWRYALPLGCTVRETSSADELDFFNDTETMLYLETAD